MTIALELVRFAGLRPSRVLVDRVSLRCPFHEDRRPSAAVLASGVLVCSSGCGSFSPFGWLVALGRTPAETMALLEELGLRDCNRDARRSPTATHAARRPSRTAEALRRDPVAALPARELGAAELERLELALAERRRFDWRLAALRGFSSSALDLARAGIGRPAAFGFRGPQAALDELRLLLPVRDELRRTVGLLAIAPNRERRNEPKVLALPGTPRLLLEVLDLDEPLASVLLVCEGELDAIAAASAGIPAVGVPGVGGYGRHAARIAELIAEHKLECALLIPDGDVAGRRGSRELAEAIAASGAPAVLADVLDDGADIGSALLTFAAEVALERPEIQPAQRRREAGDRLLTLATETEGRCNT